jgi:hypothetical protein
MYGPLHEAAGGPPAVLLGGGQLMDTHSSNAILNGSRFRVRRFTSSSRPAWASSAWSRIFPPLFSTVWDQVMIRPRLPAPSVIRLQG